MGFGLWIVAGAGAAALARLVEAGRLPLRWITELFVAMVAAILAGLTATALDFGGLREPDWRPALFAFFCAATAVGLMRLARLLRS